MVDPSLIMRAFLTAKLIITQSGDLCVQDATNQLLVIVLSYQTKQCDYLMSHADLLLYILFCVCQQVDASLQCSGNSTQSTLFVPSA